MKLPRGFSFSWKRATGLSAMQAKLSRKTGIPLSRSGRQRKLARAAGCCIPLLTAAALLAAGAVAGLGIA